MWSRTFTSAWCIVHDTRRSQSHCTSCCLPIWFYHPVGQSGLETTCCRTHGLTSALGEEFVFLAWRCHIADLATTQYHSP